MVKQLNLDDPARVDAQMKFYRDLGFPAQNGLATNAFILRRHHERGLPKIMEAWFQQVLLWSRRDQLSLNPPFLINNSLSVSGGAPLFFL